MASVDFSAAYRDSSRGSTIKALQERRKAAAAAAATTVSAPTDIHSPWQGAAQIGDVIGSSLREGRVANEESAARAQLAELMAGGITADEMGTAYSLDPDIANKWQEHAWTSEAEAAKEKTRIQERLEGRGWSVDDAAARVQADKDTAAANVAAQENAAKLVADAKVAADKFARSGTEEDRDLLAKAKVAADEAEAKAKVSAASTLVDTTRETNKQTFEMEQGAPHDPVAKAAIDLKNGIIDKATFDAIKAKETHIPAGKPGETMTPGAQEMDKKAAPDILEWKQVGGANAVKSIKDTRTAIDILQSKGGSGFLAGVSEAALPEALNKLINPDGTIAQDSIRNTVQMTLRPILGAQFTQQEGEALMKRAFDINMTPEENVRRAKLIIEQVDQIADAKQDMANYWDTHNGSLAGWVPKPIDYEALKTMDFGDAGSGSGGTSTEDHQIGTVLKSDTPGKNDIKLTATGWVDAVTGEPVQ